MLPITGDLQEILYQAYIMCVFYFCESACIIIFAKLQVYLCQIAVFHLLFRFFCENFASSFLLGDN